MSLRGVPPDSSRACVQVAPPSVVHRITEEQVAPPQPYPTAVHVLASGQDTPCIPSLVTARSSRNQVAAPSVVCRMPPCLPTAAHELKSGHDMLTRSKSRVVP